MPARELHVEGCPTGRGAGFTGHAGNEIIRARFQHIGGLL
jgi:hypothetical protein